MRIDGDKLRLILPLAATPVNIEVNVNNEQLDIECSDGRKFSVRLPCETDPEETPVCKWDRAQNTLTVTMVTANVGEVEHPADGAVLDPLLQLPPLHAHPALRLQKIPGKGKG